MKSKKVKVIMLPTTDNVSKGIILLRHLWKDNPKLECRSIWQYKKTIIVDNVKQYTVLDSSFRDECESFVPQHLYFVTDDKIKEGDWILSDTSVGAILIDGKTLTVEMLAEGQWKKVIATTDKTLMVNDITESGLVGREQLPQIPQSFVGGYCLLDGIDEVMVEYEEKLTEELIEGRTWGDAPGANNPKGRPFYMKSHGFIPKIDSHNILIIQSIKDNWSREETLSLLDNVMNDSIKHGKAIGTYHMSDLGSKYAPLDEETFKKNWIKNNL